MEEEEGTSPENLIPYLLEALSKLTDVTSPKNYLSLREALYQIHIILRVSKKVLTISALQH